MGRQRRQLNATTPRVILDSGAVLGESKGTPYVRDILREILLARSKLIVPSIVVTETYRADPKDVRLNRLLDWVFVPAADMELAKVAGSLLARTGASNAADAQVAAEAIRNAPCTILTSDYLDISLLVAGHPGIAIIDLNSRRTRQTRKR